MSVPLGPLVSIITYIWVMAVLNGLRVENPVLIAGGVAISVYVLYLYSPLPAVNHNFGMGVKEQKWGFGNYKDGETE